MSDPIDEVMKKVKPQMKPAEEVTVSSTQVNGKKEKLFNNKYYRTVNIDVTAEQQKAQEAEEKYRAAVEKKKAEEAAAHKKKNDEDAAAAHKEEVKKMLQGMGFEVK